MRHYLFALLIVFSSLSLSEDEKKEESNKFKYSSLDISLIQTDKTAVGAKASLPLPGGLYVVLERKAEGVDTSNDSYDRIINAARIGIHAGIGDIFSSISAKGKVIIQNLIKGEDVDVESSGLSKREWNELMIAFDLKDMLI